MYPTSLYNIKMDRNSIFAKLGLGLTFDIKRFANDARKLNMKVPASYYHTEKKNDENSMGSEDPYEEKAPDPSAVPVDTVKNLNNRKRKLSTSDNASDGGIRLMSGLHVTETSPVKKAKKEKRKKVDENDAAIKRKKEEVNAFRNTRKISVKGSDIPDPIASFSDMGRLLGLPQVVAENLSKMEFSDPTPIQMQAVPVMIHRRALLACAPTGSGKTLAFCLPVIHRLKKPKVGSGFRAVLLSPTRELAVQTYRIFHQLAEGTKLKIFMIDSRREKAVEKFKKSKGCRLDVLVTTPKRLVGLLDRKPRPGIDLSDVECLIVDESDKLFETNAQDGGFRQQLATIYKACNNAKVQFAMFSATYQSNVEEWCRQHLDNVVEVTVGVKNASVKSIAQKLQFVGSKEGKLMALKDLIKTGIKPPVLVFVESQDNAQKLFSDLAFESVNVDVIHAGKTQVQREEAIKKFRIGETWVLICTELLGRGMDFQGVNLVVNYDFPRSPISYVHRIGRTGRAGRHGEAVTFFTEDDTEHLRSIAGIMRDSGCSIPDHLLLLTQKRKEISKMNRTRIHKLKDERRKRRAAKALERTAE